jgi:hypothetical protein
MTSAGGFRQVNRRRSQCSKCQTLVSVHQAWARSSPRQSEMGRPPNNFINTKILSALKREHFIVHTHLLRSWVFLIRQLFCLRGSLGMKNLHLYKMPRELTPDLRRRRLEMGRRRLPFFEAKELDSSRSLVAGDASRWAFEYQHSTKRNVVRDQVPTRMNQTIGMKSYADGDLGN